MYLEIHEYENADVWRFISDSDWNAPSKLVNLPYVLFKILVLFSSLLCKQLIKKHYFYSQMAVRWQHVQLQLVWTHFYGQFRELHLWEGSCAICTLAANCRLLDDCWDDKRLPVCKFCFFILMQICKNAMFFNAEGWCSGGIAFLSFMFNKHTIPYKTLTVRISLKRTGEEKLPTWYSCIFKETPTKHRAVEATHRLACWSCLFCFPYNQRRVWNCLLSCTNSNWWKNGQECFRNKNNLRMCACCHASVESVRFFMYLSCFHPALDKKEAKKALPLYCVFSFNVQWC